MERQAETRLAMRTFAGVVVPQVEPPRRQALGARELAKRFGNERRWIERSVGRWLGRCAFMGGDHSTERRSARWGNFGCDGSIIERRSARSTREIARKAG